MIYWYRKCFSPKNNSQKLYSPRCPLWVLDDVIEVEIDLPTRTRARLWSQLLLGHILHEILEMKIQIFVCSQRNHSKDKFEHIISLLLLQRI